MFCSKCGIKLEEDAKFCPQCGNKIARSSGSVIQNANSIASSVDFQKVQVKVSSVISWLKNLEKGKKYLYGVIISVVLIILFGSMTVSVIVPAKKVECEVTWAGEPYDGSEYIGAEQQITAVYKDKEWRGSIGITTQKYRYYTGEDITLYLVDGELYKSDDIPYPTLFEEVFPFVLLICSIGSCGWFGFQYNKHKKRGLQ